MSRPVAEYRVEDGIAILTLKNPPQNALHPQLITSLFDQAKRAQNDPSVKAIVLTGSGKSFCAGFDISQFQNSVGDSVDTSSIHFAFKNLLEAGSKPTVAAIRGVALGGGLEVAMACNARVAAPGSRLGLPELTLGIIPGFGGTQRLPRLVGLKKACEMMLLSKPVPAETGLKLGLVDQVAPDADLLAAAKRFAADIAELRRPKMDSLTRTDKLESFAEALAVVSFARLQASRQAKGLKHPQLCLDAIMEGVTKGGAAGLKKETECFQAAQRLPVHAALVHLFFAQRTTRKVAGVTDAGLNPRAFTCVAVVGGGLMGSGIATALILNGFDVILKEIQQPFLDAGVGRVKANIASRVKKGALSQVAAEAALKRMTPTLSYDGFKRADMVIEAALEDLPLKQRIFADLERECRADCVLASNTSTIDIERIGDKMTGGVVSRARLLGAHFFSPAHVMPLLEIVRTPVTDKQVLVDTLELATRIKKTPVVVSNCCGFAVNRVFFPYTMAALMLVDLGMDPYRIDDVIAKFGMPMGPFRLSDLVGGDISLHVGANCAGAFPDRVYTGRLLPLLNEAKRLGEKTGSGFYAFDKSRKASPAAAALQPFLEKSRRAAAELFSPAAAAAVAKMTDQDIVEFIFFPVVNESSRVLAERVVEKPADLDVCAVMAMGFPATKGGVFFWADQLGAAHVRRRLDAFAALVGPKLSGFFSPCEFLVAVANRNGKLSDGSAAPSKL